MKLKPVLFFAGLGSISFYNAQTCLGNDFEIMNPTATITTQLSNWTLASGSHFTVSGHNSCNLGGCCTGGPAYSAILDVYNAYTDPNIGSQYPVYSVFGNSMVPSVGAAGAANPQIKQIMRGTRIMRLNNMSAGDLGIEKLRRSYPVSSSNAVFQFAYIPVLAGSHLCCDNGAMQVKVSVNGTLMPCPSYTVTVPVAQCPPSVPIAFYSANTSGYMYHHWVINAIDLTPYIGFNADIDFIVSDCTLGDHFAYVYLDANCGPMRLYVNDEAQPMELPTNTISSCGQANMCALDGMGPVAWYGPGVPASYSSPSFTNACYSTSVAGQYTLEMHPLNACAPVMREIILQISPALQLKAPPVFSLCGAPQVQISPLMVGSAAGQTFTWTHSVAGAVVSGANTSVLSTNMPGIYLVKTSNTSNTCTSQAQVTVVGCVGIEEEEAGEIISLFPNPNSGIFYLRSAKRMNDAGVEVYDLPGNCVLRERFAGWEMEVNMQGLAAGIYQVRVSTKERSYYFKVVRE